MQPPSSACTLTPASQLHYILTPCNRTHWELCRPRSKEILTKRLRLVGTHKMSEIPSWKTQLVGRISLLPLKVAVISTTLSTDVNLPFTAIIWTQLMPIPSMQTYKAYENKSISMAQKSSTSQEWTTPMQTVCDPLKCWTKFHKTCRQSLCNWQSWSHWKQGFFFNTFPYGSSDQNKANGMNCMNWKFEKWEQTKFWNSPLWWFWSNYNQWTQCSTTKPSTTSCCLVSQSLCNPGFISLINSVAQRFGWHGM